MSTQYINPSGFPENLPDEQLLEEQLKNNFSTVARLHGYTPLETASVEYVDTLSVKGVLNKEVYTIGRALAEGEEESTRALRFDLTVPFARYVAQHYAKLVFPFKRYQIQKVWRGERPQKGRFREFYQADIDVIGNGSLPLFFDAEVIETLARILSSFSFGAFTVSINNRKLLEGLFAEYGITDLKKALDALDDLQKVGEEKVRALFASEFALTSEQCDALFSVLLQKIPVGSDTLEALGTRFENATFREGFAELSEVSALLGEVDWKSINARAVIDLSVARGLDYYTGTIFETTIDSLERLGSICSGGRYANLGQKFTSKELPGVGGSIGLSRLMKVLLEEGRLNVDTLHSIDGYIEIEDEKDRPQLNQLAQKLREHNIAVDVYHRAEDSAGNQRKYAGTRRALFSLSVSGDNFTLTNISDRVPSTYVSIEAVVEAITNLKAHK